MFLKQGQFTVPFSKHNEVSRAQMISWITFILTSQEVAYTEEMLKQIFLQWTEENTHLALKGQENLLKFKKVAYPLWYNDFIFINISHVPLKVQQPPKWKTCTCCIPVEVNRNISTDFSKKELLSKICSDLSWLKGFKQLAER